jgi:hypothetical protein
VGEGTVLRQFFITRYILIAVGVMLLVAVGVAVLLAFTPPEMRMAARDVLLIFLFLLAIFTMLMFLALTIALFSLVEQAQGRAQPMIENTSALIRRVRGTTAFVNDEFATPIIQAGGGVRRGWAQLRSGRGGDRTQFP